MPGFVARAKVHGLAARPTFYVRLAKSRIVGITGQSLPILEDSYFAWFNNACSLCHFPLPCTSPKQLDVNCDLGFLLRNSSRVKRFGCLPGDAVGSRCTVNFTTGLGANAC